MPHTDPDEACRVIFASCDIPFWPQLPRLSYREFMIPQFCEGMPFLRISDEREAVWVEEGGSEDLERFYESWTDESRIAVSESHARGFYAFLEILKKKGGTDLVKGQVTGPLTFTLGLKDEKGRAVYFDEEMREISLMLLKAKARWEIEKLGAFSARQILFIDEPILSALGGSSYLGVSAEEALRLLREITGTIKAAGAIPGIHCCGNADWPMVIAAGVEIINFDAYDYLDTIALYSDEFLGFFERGGWLAWGIVPTSDSIAGAREEDLKRRFADGIGKLSRRIPEDLLLSRALLTPSCGTGSRTVEENLKIFQLLMRLKEAPL